MKSYAPPSGGWSNYINYLKFFTCVLSPSSIYLFAYLFIYLFRLIINIYLFSALCYKPVILYLFCYQTVPSLAMAPVFLWHSSIHMVSLSTTLLSGTKSCSRLICNICCHSPWMSHFLHGSLVPFIREWYQKSRPGF